MEDKEPAWTPALRGAAATRGCWLVGACIGLDSADAVMADEQETILTVIQKRCEQEAHQSTDSKAQSD